MNLSPGKCVLCTTNSRVVSPPQAENITSLLCDILDKFIDIRKFDETATTLKVCPSCLDAILQVAEYKQNIIEYSQSVVTCSLCQDSAHLISISGWKQFDLLLANIDVQSTKKCCFCLHCIHYLDLLERIKVNFLVKYPQLELGKAAEDKRKHVKTRPKFKTIKLQNAVSSSSDSEDSHDRPIRKTKNNLKSALKHLRPLKYSNFNVTACNGDKKMLGQVTFVRLNVLNETKKGEIKSVRNSNCKDSFKASYSRSSFFKIKLSKNNSKTKRSKVTSVKRNYENTSKTLPTNKRELIVKICQMDFDKMKPNIIDLDSDQDEVSLKTPSKASLKLVPKDPSSSLKKKSVTFAEDIRMVEGEKKDKADKLPLKSLLKSTEDNSINGSLESLSDEDSDPMENIVIPAIMGLSDEEQNMDDFVQEIQKNNDTIFDNLKKNSAPNNGKSKKRKTLDDNCDDDSDQSVNTNKKSKLDIEADKALIENGLAFEDKQGSEDLVSNSSFSSSRDAIVTLEEYKEIRRSGQAAGSEEPLDQTNNSSATQEESDKAEDASTKSSKQYNLEEPESRSAKVSDVDIETNDSGSPIGLLNVPRSPSELNNVDNVLVGQNVEKNTETEVPARAKDEVASHKTVEQSNRTNDNSSQDFDKSSAVRNGEDVGPFSISGSNLLEGEADCLASPVQ